MLPKNYIPIISYTLIFIAGATIWYLIFRHPCSLLAIPLLCLSFIPRRDRKLVHSSGTIVTKSMLHRYDKIKASVEACTCWADLDQPAGMLDDFAFKYGKNDLYDEVRAEYMVKFMEFSKIKNKSI